MKKHIKIVLPCTNEGEWLRITVDSILDYTRYPSFEIFIMANGDTTTDFSFLEKQAYRERVRLERVKEPLGVGKSINRAVKPGDASYYVFMDAHCLLEVGVDGVQEAGGGEPGLVWTDEEGEVFGHLTAFDGVDANLLQCRGELGQFVVAVKLGTVSEATGPGKDRGD